MAALDFHHLEADKKEISIGKALGSQSNAQYKLIELEIKKCAILCCRCHREFHAGAITLDTVPFKPENL